jgi:putative ABC transport system permease protein
VQSLAPDLRSTLCLADGADPGAPLAWVGADWWLGCFAYRVDLSPWPFLAAGAGALVVAVAAVSTQALRAARIDPATTLRDE